MRRDFEIAKNKHWYRIPVKSAPKQVREAAYLAFYQTKVFGEEKWAIPKDNARNNFLTSRGWSVLHFGSKDINENMPNCVAMVKYSINRLGGRWQRTRKGASIRS